MEERNILLTAFRGSSAESLIRDKKNISDFDRFQRRIFDVIAHMCQAEKHG